MNSLEIGQEIGLIPLSHGRVAQNSIRSFRGRLDHMIKNKQLPKEGFNDAEVKSILSEFAMADSNNFSGKIGVGEREGRVFSRLVQDRNFEGTV